MGDNHPDFPLDGAYAAFFYYQSQRLTSADPEGNDPAILLRALRDLHVEFSVCKISVRCEYVLAV